MKAYSRNPWLVENIDDFNFLCCPECAYKSKIEEAFISHAVENHPKSKASDIFSEEDEESTSKIKTAQKLKKVVKVITVPKNIENINMVEVTEKDQAVEDGDPDDFTALESIKDDLEEGAIISDPATIDPITHISIKEENEDGVDDSEAKNPFYGCPECQKMFKNIGEVEKHIRTNHDSDVTENVVRCSECKMELPKDHEAIKHHMRTEHMPTKRKQISDSDSENQFEDDPTFDNFEEDAEWTGFGLKKKKKIKTNTTTEVPENFKTYDPDRKKYACAYCGDKFPQKLVRAQHEKAEHVNSEGKLLEITCEKCQEILPSAVHFRRHSIDKHQKYNHTTKNKESFCCDECGKTFNGVFPLNNHKRTVHVDKNKKDFKCDLCDYTSYAKRYIIDHKAKAHGEYKHMCEQCGRKFKYPWDMKRHMCAPNHELGPEDLKCFPCNRQFTESKYYMVHYLRKHKTLPPGYEGRDIFKCEFENCEQICLTKYHLDNHVQKVHTSREGRKVGDHKQSDPQYCDRCDQHFPSDMYLLVHYKKVHNEIPPLYQNRKQYPCDLCSEVYFSTQSLYKHKKKHTISSAESATAGSTAKRQKDVPVDCPQCQKTLSSGAKLRQHIKNMHENRSVKCPTCHKAFGTAQGRAQHLKYCMKKESKVDIEPTKQQTKRTNIVSVSRVGQTVTPQQSATWPRTEAQNAVDSINQYRW